VLGEISEQHWIDLANRAIEIDFDAGLRRLGLAGHDAAGGQDGTHQEELASHGCKRYHPRRRAV
jgi:hypothetical protein